MKSITLLIILFISLSSYSGEPSCSETSGNAALVIIDMQPFFSTQKGSHNKKENKIKINQVIAEQVAAINEAKMAKIPIIFIEYDFSDEPGLGKITQTDEKLVEAVKGYSDVKYITKTTDGMFEKHNTGLETLNTHLKQKQIGTLLIAGANGGACVKRSITGAIQNNCNVIAYNKGIADFNYEDFIYPYKGHYRGIKPNCKNCYFREVSSIDGIIKYMVNNSSREAVRDRAISKAKQ